MANFLFSTILLILLVVLGYYIDSKQAPRIRKDVEELYINGKFAIGTVSAVTAGTYGQPMVLGAVYYRFEASTGTRYANLGGAIVKQISEATDKIFKNRLRETKSGDQFLVLYDENDPKNAILLLDHPIKSDSDFARYKAEIEERRKYPEWRGYK